MALRHLAIIPDGNRRWAKEKGLVRTAGHVRAGAYENLYPLLEECRELGIEYVSLWGFSSENWNRSTKEIDTIFEVIFRGLGRMIEEAEKEGYLVRHLGRKDRLPQELLELLERVERETAENKGLKVLLCIDYGGRDEILRAVEKFVDSGKELNEKCFMTFLDTAGAPDPELIIRTGGEKRLSGFMPLQSVYSEIYFTDTYFPDFDRRDLREAVAWFSAIQRNFGS